MRGNTVKLADGTRIRLSPGSHTSPREGVCVVELASLLAGEEFSDRPQCVCPVIGAFLRAWNDRAAYAERQLLQPYAARIVGSRGDDRVTRRRRDMCLDWIAERTRAAAARRPGRLRLRTRIGVACGAEAGVRLDEGAGEYAARLAFARADAGGAFELLDRLLAAGEGPAAGRRNGHAVTTGRHPVDADELVSGNGNGASGNGSRANGNAVGGNGNGRRAGTGARSTTGPGGGRWN